MTNKRIRRSNDREHYARRDVRSYSDDPGDVAPFSAINYVTGEYIACKSADHACAIAFGRNKRNRNLDWMACVRTSTNFITL